MFEGSDAGEEAARIVEAVSAGADEDGSVALGQLAGDLRASGVTSWDDAQRIIEERRASSPAAVAELLGEAASAVRDRAVDD